MAQDVGLSADSTAVDDSGVIYTADPEAEAEV